MQEISFDARIAIIIGAAAIAFELALFTVIFNCIKSNRTFKQAFKFKNKLQLLTFC